MRTKAEISETLCKKVKKHMVGRKQRWLAQQLSITDTALSNRINGIHAFKKQEITSMANIFNDKTILEHC